MPMPMQCNICDKLFTESERVGICDECYFDHLQEEQEWRKEKEQELCRCTTTTGGRCVNCGKDLKGE